MFKDPIINDGPPHDLDFVEIECLLSETHHE